MAFCEAAPGMVGLETALGLARASRVATRKGAGTDVLAAGSHRRAIERPRRTGEAGGSPANLCVIDPERRWVVDPSTLASRSRNTPFAGRELRARSATPFWRASRWSSGRRRSDDRR